MDSIGVASVHNGSDGLLDDFLIVLKLLSWCSGWYTGMSYCDVVHIALLDE